MFDELKEVKHFKEITDFKSLVMWKAYRKTRTQDPKVGPQTWDS